MGSAIIPTQVNNSTHSANAAEIIQQCQKLGTGSRLSGHSIHWWPTRHIRDSPEPLQQFFSGFVSGSPST